MWQKEARTRREEGREDEGRGWVGRATGLESADWNRNLSSVYCVRDLKYMHSLSTP